LKTLNELFFESNTAEEFSANYIDYLTGLLKQLDYKIIENIIRKFIETNEKGSTIYFIGNGGSASTASHFANDITVGTSINNQTPFKSISLCDNISILTAIGNDYGYPEIFVKQLKALLTKDDLLLALSVSGNSENIIKAVDYAQNIGSFTIGCTGFDGGKLKSIVDINLHIPTNKGEYGPVEDIFMILDHIIYSYIKFIRS